MERRRNDTTNRRTMRNRTSRVLQDDGRTEYNPNRMSVQVVQNYDVALKSENLMDLIGGDSPFSEGSSEDLDGLGLSRGLGAEDTEALEKANLEAQKEKERAEANAKQAEVAYKKAQAEEAK